MSFIRAMEHIFSFRKMKFGFASLNRTFCLSPHENIFTIALIIIHYFYDIITLVSNKQPIKQFNPQSYCPGPSFSKHHKSVTMVSCISPKFIHPNQLLKSISLCSIFFSERVSIQVQYIRFRAFCCYFSLRYNIFNSANSYKNCFEKLGPDRSHW